MFRVYVQTIMRKKLVDLIGNHVSKNPPRRKYGDGGFKGVGSRGAQGEGWVCGGVFRGVQERGGSEDGVGGGIG